MFLELAQGGDAAMLVTGDKDLLALNDTRLKQLRFGILTPQQALTHWP